ncbi:MAG: MoaD/ThiS family protein [Chloroflexi bacterium]|nr:MoaD/ThiS family protein [Chloroflexota bacterium]
MKVTVRLFAAPREALGTGTVEQELPSGSTLQDLLDALLERFPTLRPYAPVCHFALNRCHTTCDPELHDGDEVALIPPVGGG